MKRAIVAVLIVLGGIALIFSAMHVPPKPGRPGAGTSVQASSGLEPSRREAYLRGLTNGLRYERERSILPVWKRGQDCAQAYAQKMADTDRLRHSTSTAACPWNGENVGKGFTVAQVHTAFANSASHRPNLLFRGWTRMAVGIVYDGRFFWVVEWFKV